MAAARPGVADMAAAQWSCSSTTGLGEGYRFRGGYLDGIEMIGLERKNRACMSRFRHWKLIGPSNVQNLGES